MGRKRVSPWVIWFDGTELDAKIAIALCLSMIREAVKEITKYKKKYGE